MMVQRAACLVIAAAYAFDTLPGQELTTEEAMRLVGDRKAWRAIFSDNYPELVAEGFAWPEGPTWIEEEKALIFSDTITGKLHRFRDGAVSVLRTSAGGCAVDEDDITVTRLRDAMQPLAAAASGPTDEFTDQYEATKAAVLQALRDQAAADARGAQACDAEQLEPGSNGMAIVGDKIAVCQHGARRLAFLDLATMNEELIVDKHGRARLNGPNDVVATPDALYFTDPYYALLEKGRPADAAYADDKSALGFAGIYRYDLRTKDLEVLESSLARPNGIGIVNKTHLVVSDCCQGHAADCPAGEARWLVWPFRGDGYLRRGAQVKIVHRDFVKKGCSDGLAFHEASQTLVASCPGGVCLVDLDAGEVVAKMHLGRSVSNVAFGGGYAWITADKSLWRVALREERRDRRRREL